MATNEAQARWRAKVRAEREPVPRYCRAVMVWDERVMTPTSGRLALLASDILTGWTERGPGPQTLSQLMGFGTGRETLTEASKIAQRGLERALSEIAAEDVAEASIRAGLHHAKRLITAPRRRTDGNALFRVMLATNGGMSPAHLVGPSDGATSDPMEDE